MDSNGHSSDPKPSADTPTIAAPTKPPLKARLLKTGATVAKGFAILGGFAAAMAATVHYGNRFGLFARTGTAAHHLIGQATEPVVQSWASVQAKVTALDRADDENTRLRTENAELKLKVESLEFSCQAKNADLATQRAGSRLSRETGSKIGRTIASFNYRIPEQLPPAQLYVLGVSYFKAGENEKAAAILSFLATLDDSAAYKNARDLLMTGVAWYRVDNLEIADQFFDEVLKMPETAATNPYQAKARVWKGLLSERQGKHIKAQFWLREVVDHHPHSTEAAWINGGINAASAEEKHDASPEH